MINSIVRFFKTKEEVVIEPEVEIVSEVMTDFTKRFDVIVEKRNHKIEGYNRQIAVLEASRNYAQEEADKAKAASDKLKDFFGIKGE